MAKGKRVVIEIEPKETQKVGQEVSSELVLYVDKKISSEFIINNPEDTKTKVIELFSPVFNQISEWKEKVNGIEVKGEDDKESMALARESRLFVKNTRVSLEKKVLQEINEVKDRMKPLLNEQMFWKDILDFAKSLMGNIETIAGQKEKYLENLKKEKRSRIIAERMEKAKQYEGFMPFRPDISYLSDEEFELDLKLGKLAFDEHQKEIEERQKLEKEREEREKKLIAQQNRIRKISSTGMIFDEADNKYFYKNVCEITQDMIEKISDEEFDFYIKSFDKKISEFIQKERDLENERISKKREELIRRAGLFLDSVLKTDGLYYCPKPSECTFMMSHDELYMLSPVILETKIEKHNFEAEQNRFRIAEEQEAIKQKQIKDEAEKQFKIAQLKEQQERERKEMEQKRLEDEERAKRAKAPDKEKLKRLSDVIHDCKVTNVPSEESMNTEFGKKISMDVYNLLGKVVKYIDDSIEKM